MSKKIEKLKKPNREKKLIKPIRIHQIKFILCYL